MKNFVSLEYTLNIKFKKLKEHSYYFRAWVIIKDACSNKNIEINIGVENKNNWLHFFTGFNCYMSIASTGVINIKGDIDVAIRHINIPNIKRETANVTTVNRNRTIEVNTFTFKTADINELNSMIFKILKTDTSANNIVNDITFS